MTDHEMTPEKAYRDLADRVEGATGLTRVRLAELLYEHEGFVDLAHGGNAPDREVPSWIEHYQEQPHAGDCTGLPASCMTCHGTMALEQWDQFIGMLARAHAARIGRVG